MRTVLSIAVIASVALGLVFMALAAEPVRLERTGTGIYSVSQTRKVEDPTLPAGYRSVSSSIKLQMETTRVPAVLGTYFGIGFVLRSEKENTVRFRTIWHFPAQGLTNPATGQTSYSSSHERTAGINTPLHAGYGFGHDWIRVPGTWRIEIWVDELKLAEQVFEVFLP